MEKLDFLIYSFVLSLCLILGAGAYRYDHHTSDAQNSQSPPSRRHSFLHGNNTAGQESKDVRGAQDDYRTIRVTIIPGRLRGRELAIFIISCVSGIGGLAGIGFATINIILLRRQTKEIHQQRITMQDTLAYMDRQTRILSESVGVAKRSADTTDASLAAMINKERGRLSIELGSHQFGSLPLIKFKITCHGTTPAYVVSSKAITSLVAMPDYGWHAEAFGFPIHNLPLVIPVGVHEGFAYILDATRQEGLLGEIDNTGRITEEIVKGERYLHIRVRILYKDVFDSEREHELQISKVYGVKLIEKPRTFTELFSLKPPEMVFTPYAEWSDSKYKYGEMEER